MKPKEPNKFTANELEVIKLIAEGYSLREAAAQLERSYPSVVAAVRRAMEKTQTLSSAHLVGYAYKNNFLTAA